MDRIKHIASKALLVYVAIVTVASSLAYAPAVSAQVSVLADATRDPIMIQEKVQGEVNKPLSVAIIQVLLNLISFVANRLAYDAALAIASGGPGQSSNFEYRSAEEYGEDLFNDVLGEAIGSLSEGLNDIGVEYNVCAPTDPGKLLNLQLGIAEGATRQEPKCNFRDIQSNWEGYLAKLDESTDPQQVWKDFSASFGRGQSELGSTVEILAQTVNNATGEQTLGTAELLEKDGFKDVSDFITGNVKTPSTVLEDQFKGQLNKAQDNQGEALQGALFGNEGALLQIGVSAGSVFLNTLLSQLTNKIYNGLFEPPTTAGVFNPDFIDVSGRDRARETFKDLLSAPIQTIDQYNVVNQFVTCPGAANRGPNNCVVDTSFAAAIARAGAGEALTVQDAIDEGLLNGDWPLVRPGGAENQDPFCYTQGYCHGNIVKLRIARVLPVGWEIAAEKSGDGRDVITLQGAIDQFNNCSDNPDDLINNENPYCHLVDPNWVLKYPQTQCRAQVFGQTLALQNSAERAQTCVDTPSCIEEDASGNCIGGYGYCTRERNTWRFDGDSCPVQYASCSTLTSRTGTRESLLTNTVDFADCNADNAGCLQHFTDRLLDSNDDADPTDDQYIFATGFCTNIADFGDACTSDEDCTIANSCLAFDDPFLPAPLQGYENNAQYMDAHAVSCDPAQEGCTQLVRATGTTFNALPNGSLETDADEDGQPDGWYIDPLAIYDTAGSTALYGTDAAVLEFGWQGMSLENRVYLAPNQFYTFSYNLKQTTSTPTSSAALLRFQDADGLDQQVGYPLMPEPTAATACFAGGNAIALQGTPTGTTFERFSCSFSTKNEPVWMSLSLIVGLGQGAIDGLQLDEREVTTDFAVGYSSRSEVNLKKAPEWLGCTGNPTDPEACGNFAKVCAPSEDGCTAYTPHDGGPMVPGIVSANDYCPSECVGYSSYRQMETNFSQTVFPIHFISSSADACTATEVGCSEFTNLDALAEGGETRQYFTGVRVCQEVAEAAATNAGFETFYTWEGSDEEGFQLRTWTLKGSDATGGAPCTNFDAASGNCQDATSSITAGCASHADTIADPDCREFYDVEGDIHYRYYSETVTIDPDCSPFRKTVSNQTDCSTSNGVWNAASGNCTYNIMASESQTCSASANGCREYRGNTGNNTRTVINENFEGGDVSYWDDAWTAPISDPPIYSNESIAATGHSAELSSTSSSPNPTMYAELTNGQIQEGFSYTLSFWAKGDGLLTSLLQDWDGEVAHFAQNMPLTADWELYTLGPLDPATYPGTPPSGMAFEQTMLRFDGGSLGTSIYIDNIVLEEIQDRAYLIEDSWVTPPSCDQTPSGANAPQHFLGCKEYTDHRGTDVNLKSFTSICREEVIGCEGFFNTQNSTATNAQAFNLTCDYGSVVSALTPCTFNSEEVCNVRPGQQTCTFNYDGVSHPDALSTVIEDDSVVVERDHKVFLVDSPQHRCSPDAIGCTGYGVPDYDLTNEVIESFAPVFKLNLPDTYDRILCGADDLFCEAYSTDDSNLLYFKNPGDQKCEYKEGVLIEGGSYFGWFRQETDEPCYYNDVNEDGFDAATDLTSAYLIGGTESGIWRNGDTSTTVATSYDGWVGLCPDVQNGCSEFVDPVDKADGVYPSGRPYYFLNNDKISEESASISRKCDGLISQETGCVGFNDGSIPFVTFNASATYVTSWHAQELISQPNFTPVSPIDCSIDGAGAYDTNGDGTPDVDLCENRCFYPVTVGYNAVTNEPFTGLETGGSCYTNQDCGTISDDFGNDVSGFCAVNTLASSLGGYCANVLTGQIGGSCDPDAAVHLCTIETPNCLPVTGITGPQANDSNTILGVRRDRSCSEWLACDSQFTTFDAQQGRTVNVCNSVSLCNEFSIQGGDASYCAGWTDSPRQILDEDVYAARDVTWYGSEYSGYSIPNQYGIEHYNQINIHPAKWCTNGATGAFLNDSDAGQTFYDEENGVWTSGLPTVCSTNDDCQDLFTEAEGEPDLEECATAFPDYRLSVWLGPCATGTDNGDACSVGTCSDTGIACAQESHCASSETCVLGLNANNGSCYNEQCVATVTGQQEIDVNARQECRGYPESNAPFPNEVVQDWSNPEPPSSEPERIFAGTELRATSMRPGFSNVRYCANGELCECSYTTSEYDSGARTINVEIGATPPAGICNGGPDSGIACTEDSECNGGVCVYKTAENDFVGWNGYCLQRDGSINILGNAEKNACLLWLPVDQLDGDTDLYAKFTEAGFPINNTAYCTDTSLFVDVFTTNAQDTDSDDIFDTIYPACARSFGGGITSYSYATNANDELGWFLDVGLAQGDSQGNAQFPDPTGGNEAFCNEGNYNSCWARVFCPKNHFAIIGACKTNDLCCDDGDCSKDGASPDTHGCPYFCVPNGSKTQLDSGLGEAGTTCEPPAGYEYNPVPINSVFFDDGEFDPNREQDNVYGVTEYRGVNGSSSHDDIVDYFDPVGPQPLGYLIGSEELFADYTEDYASCGTLGVEFDEDREDSYYVPLWPTNANERSIWDFQNRAQYYLGCKELTYASAEDGFDDDFIGNAAFTNRTLQELPAPYELEDEPSGEVLGYTGATIPRRVGRSLLEYELDEDELILAEAAGDMYPLPVAACQIGESLKTPSELEMETSCVTGSILGRSYENAQYSVPYYLQDLQQCNTDSDCAGYIDTSGKSCEGGSDDFNCFIECGEMALKYNPAAQAALAADPLDSGIIADPDTDPANAWDSSRGDIFCASLGLGECIQSPSGTAGNNPATSPSGLFADQAAYICAAYYGSGTDVNGDGVFDGDDEDALQGYEFNTCNDAMIAGVVPDFTNHGAPGFNGTPLQIEQNWFAAFLGGPTAPDFAWSSDYYSTSTSVSMWQTRAVNTFNSTSASPGMDLFDNPFVEPSRQCDGAGLPYSNIACNNVQDCIGITNPNCNAEGFCHYPGARDTYPEQLSVDSSASAFDRLKQFFAYLHTKWTFDDKVSLIDGNPSQTNYDDVNRGYYEEDSNANVDIRSGGDGHGTGPNNGAPGAPVVASVTGPCIGDNCTEGAEGQFSVNGSSGTAFNSQSSFLAQVEFFAWTDPNQYPLRNVIVDWGDGLDTTWVSPSILPDPSANAWGRGSTSGSTADDNYYKGHRGLDATGETICSPTDDDDKEWGKTPESCQQEPFRFQHHYRCTAGMFAWLNTSGRFCDYAPGTNTLINSPCTDGAQCVFQPRVHVVDNWDYCTGSCDTGAHPDLNCFDSRTTSGECRHGDLPRTIPPDETVNYDNPWINWAGTVEVTPQ